MSRMKSYTHSPPLFQDVWTYTIATSNSCTRELKNLEHLWQVEIKSVLVSVAADSVAPLSPAVGAI